MRRWPALAWGLVLAACDNASVPPHKADEGPGLLRVVYRDAHAEMVLMVPDQGRGEAVSKAIGRDCAAPLLIDGRSGAVRVLSEAEVQARLRTMQLTGATRGACPRP